MESDARRNEFMPTNERDTQMYFEGFSGQFVGVFSCMYALVVTVKAINQISNDRSRVMNVWRLQPCILPSCCVLLFFVGLFSVLLVFLGVLFILVVFSVFYTL